MPLIGENGLFTLNGFAHQLSFLLKLNITMSAHFFFSWHHIFRFLARLILGQSDRSYENFPSIIKINREALAVDDSTIQHSKIYYPIGGKSL